MGLKKLLKPNWVKVLFFFILIIPLSMIAYPIVNMAFMSLALITIGLIKNLSPSFTLSGNFIFLFPLFICLALVYLTSCGAEGIYRRTQSKVFIYVSTAIGIIFIIIFGRFFIYPFFVPYKIIKDSPAPGCIVHRGISSGGCSGKTIIRDLKIEPEIPCLHIEINNCNGGVLTIYNKCGRDLKIENLDLPYTRVSSYEEDQYIKLIKDENGNAVAKDFRTLGAGEFDKLRNNKYDLISTIGKVGNEQFEISLINSKELKITPSFDCITFRLIRLNWVNDAIQIKNNCEEEVTVNGDIVKPYIKKIEEPGGSYTIEFLKDQSGDVVANQTRGNYASYIPTKTETLSATGMFDGKQFTISYIKTEKLCE